MPWFPAALPALGVGLSLWMARQSAGGRGLPGCGAESGCDAVTRSRWSKWLGIPVAVPAAVLYLVIFASFVALVASSGDRYRHIAGDVLLSAAPLLAASAVWFVGLQWLVVRRFCLYCLLLHGIGLAVAGTITFGLPGGGFRFAYAGLPAGELLLVLSTSAAGVAALVLGQVLVEPKMYAVQKVDGCELPVASEESEEIDSCHPLVASGGDTTAVVHLPAPAPTLPSPGVPGEGKNGRGGARSHPATGSSQLATVAPNPYLGRRITTAGRVPLAGGVWPALGEPTARDVLVFLFCYTCANCRHLFGLLDEAMAREPGRFALMMVPVPTDPGCNPDIKYCGPEHADACAYARLALSVWKADWSTFAEFNDFLFGGGKLPTLAAARGRAEVIVGRGLRDPREPNVETDRLVGMGVSLHKTAGSELTPTLLMPRNYLAGHVPTGEKLEEILAREIGVLARQAGVK